MKFVLALFLVTMTCCASAQSIDRLSAASPQDDLQPNLLVVLREPFNLKARLDAVISLVESGSSGYEGAGATPKSVCEAAEFVEHSTHMRRPIRHAIEYRDYYVFSDAVPRDLRELIIAGDPTKPNTSKLFTSGYAVRKGQKKIYSFLLPVE
jgi:hypothetical protein